jgi:IclR family KDG regulon transcriptional repressor
MVLPGGMALPKDKIYTRSLERALRILCAFSNEKREMSLAELSQSLSLPKSTAYRLCVTLTKYDFLKYDADQAKYTLGLKLFDLGGVVFSSFSLRDAASSHLTQLQHNTKESVFLGILQDDHLMYLDKRETPENPIRFRTEIGTLRQPYFGMLGQVLLSYLPEREVGRILKGNPLKPITRKSLQTRENLNTRLEKIREQGFSLEKGEVIDGVIGVAAPVRNHLGKVIAAVGIRFIGLSAGKEREKQLIRDVCETARRISTDLGYQPK